MGGGGANALQSAFSTGVLFALLQGAIYKVCCSPDQHSSCVSSSNVGGLPCYASKLLYPAALNTFLCNVAAGQGVFRAKGRGHQLREGEARAANNWLPSKLALVAAFFPPLYIQ